MLFGFGEVKDWLFKLTILFCYFLLAFYTREDLVDLLSYWFELAARFCDV